MISLSDDITYGVIQYIIYRPLIVKTTHITTAIIPVKILNALLIISMIPPI